MRISDWSSDVCSSDLKEAKAAASVLGQALDLLRAGKPARLTEPKDIEEERILKQAQLLTTKPVLYVCNVEEAKAATGNAHSEAVFARARAEGARSEEHTSELQSLMRISYAVFCLNKKNKKCKTRNTDN